MRVVGYLPRPPPVPAAELAQWLGLYLSLRLVLPPGPATEGNPQWTRTARAGPGEPKHFLPAPRAECPECGEVPDPSLKVRFRHTFVLFLVALKEMPYWAETLRMKDGDGPGHLRGEATISLATRTRISGRGRIDGCQCVEPVTRGAPPRPKRQ